LTLDQILGGPFDTVLDVGGNVGDFAEQAATLWPGARIISFEPLLHIAAVNEARAHRTPSEPARWQVETVAVSSGHGRAEILYNVAQPSASTMQQPGSVRRNLFRIEDRWEPIEIVTAPLDDWLQDVTGRLLVKIDVEGHEGSVIFGGRRVLERAATVVCEVQNMPGVFAQGVLPVYVDNALQRCGLRFHGVLDVLHAPDGSIVQFDGIWRR
jgi:FkbM family methyltransferase